MCVFGRVIFVCVEFIEVVVGCDDFKVIRF